MRHQAHNPQTVVIDGSWYIFHIGGGNARAAPRDCNETLNSTMLRHGTAAQFCPAAKGFAAHAASCISNAACNSSTHCDCGSGGVLEQGDCGDGDRAPGFDKTMLTKVK